MSIPHSIYQRSIDLAGEIKLAGQLVAECEQAEAIKTDELAIAVGNTQRQRDNLARLLAERETLAEQAAAAVRTAGDDAPATDHQPMIGVRVGTSGVEFELHAETRSFDPIVETEDRFPFENEAFKWANGEIKF